MAITKGMFSLKAKSIGLNEIVCYQWGTKKETMGVTSRHIFNANSIRDVGQTATYHANQVVTESPKGRRALIDNVVSSNGWFGSGTAYAAAHALNAYPEDLCLDQFETPTAYQSPWFDTGKEAIKTSFQGWINEFVAAGGTLDVILDDDESGVGWVNGEGIPTGHWRAIWNDPRYISRGLSANIAPFVIYDTDQANWKGRAELLRHFADAKNYAIFNPLKSAFPRLFGSDYDFHYVLDNEVMYAPDLNGRPQMGYGKYGTHETYPFYGWMRQINNFKWPGTGASNYAYSAFNAVRWHVNVIRSSRRSDPTRRFAPWIGRYDWTGEQVSLGNTLYWEENIYQLALNGTDHFLGFFPLLNPSADITNFNKVERILQELRALGITVHQTPVTSEFVPYNSDVIASGVILGNGNVLWRVTVPSGTTEIKVTYNGSLQSNITIPNHIDGGAGAGVWHTTTEGVDVKFFLTTTDHTRATPAISITQPGDSDSFYAGSNVAPSPQASASGDTIANVAYFYAGENGGQSAGSVAPYTNSHVYFIVGEMPVFAVGVGALGGVGTSTLVSPTTTGNIPTVTTATPSGGVGTFSCDGNITNIGSTRVHTRGIVYGASANPIVGVNTTVSDNISLYAVGSFSKTATSVAPGTYHVRAFATNVVGTGYGSDQTVIVS